VRAQSQIQRTLGAPEAVDRIAAILGAERFPSRRALGRRICEEFDFRDPRGRWQLAGCLKALNILATRSERIVLPVPQSGVPRGERPYQLAAGVVLAEHVPERLELVRELSIQRVRKGPGRRIWNTLIANEHRQGMTIFAGAQMRYLVASAHGWLGAVGFAAAALHLAARERWMGWSDEQRRACLNRVVGLSRFLIRGGCANLASHVLGHVLRRLPEDFRARYGYRPWLVETFVEEGQRGTSLKAANFVVLGQTAGRGRQDRHKRRAAGPKTVMAYEWSRKWREQLGVAWVDPAPQREPGEGLDGEAWARNEFGGARLGDKRLTDRLVHSAQLLARRPGESIARGLERGKNASVDGYYRLIEKPEDSKVSVKSLLAPHRERTIQRMRGRRTVLCIQDGSDLRFARRPGCVGLEVIGRNQTSSKTKGLHLHLTLAVTSEGLPLGVLRCGFGTPRKADGGKSRRWIDSLRDIGQAAQSLTRKTRLISVMDREADFFDLFREREREGRVEILVRAKHDRKLDSQGGKLFTTMAEGPADGSMEVQIEGLTERPKASRKQARPARKKRLASCDLRYRRLELPATGKGGEPVTMWGVHLVEIDPPADEKAVQWYLLTSMEVGSAEAAQQMVEHYLQRWRIEDYFRVLKMGCGAKRTAFRTALRLQRAIAIKSVIAWRLMVLTLLGREVPELDAELLFTAPELDFLHDYAREYGVEAPDHLGTAMRLVAHFGGHRGRRQDRPPGHQTIWRGYNKLTTATVGHLVCSKWGGRSRTET
jgi:hypothetical protein